MPKAVIALFDQVEVLDFAGPFDVLSCAADDRGRPCFEVSLAAERQQVVCRGGLLVSRQAELSAAADCDVFIVPGGPGARSAEGQPAVAEAARRAAASGAVVASVCTGAFILARAGLLDGLTATTHTSRLDELAAAYPEITVLPDKVIDQGNIITAGGVASGIDLCLHLLERMFGAKARAREAKRLDGPWR